MRKQKNLGFNLRKDDLIKRHRELRKKSKDPTDVVYKISKIVDPDSSRSIEIQEKESEKKQKGEV